ncbi:endo-beta-1,4-glucanase D [Colletotrichum liriopes]|uniref:lytic cellulose monooxygenase (C4-dehydrogenating) n=1 Tax=Colletotrichum liriopes TaxID=708192 RepID=A0AA37GI49_9PEZI|nr:endo-beta-1,4-glucanase D [Colletotrichum liriopes]
MKSYAALALTASMANMVAGHAIFQQLWVNGEDQASTCVRMPASNSPIEDPTSNNMRCNAGSAAATSTCGVKAGDTITVEMHQHNDRDCTKEAIGGAHHGPVMAYLSAVDDAAAADGSTPFFKIFESGYFAENKTWGNDLINEGCGKQNIVIPSDIAPGDYLLRAETVALHAAGSANGAQYYMSCYQLKIEGTGTAKPEGH